MHGRKVFLKVAKSSIGRLKQFWGVSWIDSGCPEKNWMSKILVYLFLMFLKQFFKKLKTFFGHPKKVFVSQCGSLPRAGATPGQPRSTGEIKLDKQVSTIHQG